MGKKKKGKGIPPIKPNQYLSHLMPAGAPKVEYKVGITPTKPAEKPSIKPNRYLPHLISQDPPNSQSIIDNAQRSIVSKEANVPHSVANRPDARYCDYRDAPGEIAPPDKLHELKVDHMNCAGPSSWNDRACKEWDNFPSHPDMHRPPVLPDPDGPVPDQGPCMDRSRVGPFWDRSYDCPPPNMNRLVDSIIEERPPNWDEIRPNDRDRPSYGMFDRPPDWDGPREGLLNRHPNWDGSRNGPPNSSYLDIPRGGPNWDRPVDGPPGLECSSRYRDPNFRDNEQRTGEDLRSSNISIYGGNNREGPENSTGRSMKVSMDRPMGGEPQRDRLDYLPWSDNSICRPDASRSPYRFLAEREDSMLREAKDRMKSQNEETVLSRIESSRRPGPLPLIDGIIQPIVIEDRKRPRTPENNSTCGRLNQCKKIKLEMPEIIQLNDDDVMVVENDTNQLINPPMDDNRVMPSTPKFDQLKEQLCQRSIPIERPKPRGFYVLLIVPRKKVFRLRPSDVPKIEDTICNKLYSAACSANVDSFPQFRFNGLRFLNSSAIEIICMNRETALWLLNTNLCSPHLRVRVVYPGDTRILAIISFAARFNACANDLRDHLKHQNPGLEVFSWRNGVVTNFKKAPQKLYSFTVDGHTLRYLENSNWELFFGTERLKVKKVKCNYLTLDPIMI